MIYLFIGLVIGIVMGLTGAGGALVAIPLFMHFFKMPLKEATVYSLIAVVLAALLNFWTQRKMANIKLGFSIVLFSAAGSFIGTPIKKSLPDGVVVALLALISAYALFTVWRKSKATIGSESKTNAYITGIVGINLGILTTLTGLGGGVLIMPVLMNFYSLDQTKATATSLLTISLSSLISFLIQWQKGFQIDWNLGLVYLVMGIVIAAYLLKFALLRLPKQRIDFVRQLVFTLVVILSLGKIFQN